jgi:hypothetical protein
MNFARVAAAAVVAWIVSVPVGYVANEIVLRGLYDANAAAFRPPAALQANLPIGFGLMLIGFLAFAYAYAKGYEGTNGTMEGIRFGVLVAIMIDGFSVVWNYVTTPISGSLSMAMMIDIIVEFALYGAIVGSIYKPLRSAVRHPATT